MRSIADALRREAADRVKAMSADERLALAARLAQDDLALFCQATGLSEAQATRHLAARRQTGRRHSRVAASFIDEGG